MQTVACKTSVLITTISVRSPSTQVCRSCLHLPLPSLHDIDLSSSWSESSDFVDPTILLAFRTILFDSSLARSLINRSIHQLKHCRFLRFPISPRLFRPRIAIPNRSKFGINCISEPLLILSSNTLLSSF